MLKVHWLGIKYKKLQFKGISHNWNLVWLYVGGFFMIKKKTLYTWYSFRSHFQMVMNVFRSEKLNLHETLIYVNIMITLLPPNSLLMLSHIHGNLFMLTVYRHFSLSRWIISLVKSCIKAGQDILSFTTNKTTTKYVYQIFSSWK